METTKSMESDLRALIAAGEKAIPGDWLESAPKVLAGDGTQQVCWAVGKNNATFIAMAGCARSALAAAVKLIEVARRHELLVVRHRRDQSLGRLQLPPENVFATEEGLAKANECCDRLNEVADAENELIRTLVELDPDFAKEFSAATGYVEPNQTSEPS